MLFQVPSCQIVRYRISSLRRRQTVSYFLVVNCFVTEPMDAHRDEFAEERKRIRILADNSNVGERGRWGRGRGGEKQGKGRLESG